MANSYILHGWHLSYYTGKVMCYLRYKGIPFDGPRVSAWTLLHSIKRRFGAAVMPVLVTPQGEWLQDSGHIIATMEQRYPRYSVNPDDPVLRFASCLMEAWGDEWWVPIAMHTRWSYAENYALFEADAGAQLLPGFPAFMQRAAVARVAAQLRGMLHGAGVRPEQFGVLEAWSSAMLDLLDTHFAKYPYLFGSRPALGDFGLVGTLYGHLGRDPWPAREWIARRPHLRAWIDRMAAPEPGMPDMAGPASGIPAPASVVAQPRWEAKVPATLEPVFKIIFAEFTSYIAQINAQVATTVKAAVAAPATDRPNTPAGASATATPRSGLLRRALQDIAVPTGFGTVRRTALPFAVWKAQQVLDVFARLSAPDQQAVRAWAQPLGGDAFLQLQLTPLERQGLRVRPGVAT